MGLAKVVGIGGDPIPGSHFIDILEYSKTTRLLKPSLRWAKSAAIAEEEAAAYIKANVMKPVVGYIAGVTAPPGKRMGYVGAIIAGGRAQ